MRILVILCLAFSACAHPYIQQWHDQDFTVCCKGAGCGQSDFKDKADEFCPGEKKVTGGFLSDAGSHSYFNSFTHTVQTENVTHACQTYHCERAPAGK